jgi:cyclopropane fatty-acyl-phospholipid synthase-like methyltransferase
MGTKDFGALDKFIARWRLSKVFSHITKGDKILDFGCGSQAYFLFAAEELLSEGVGIDYDVETKQLSPKLRTIGGKFEQQLPFESESFDKIVMLAVLEHIPLDKVDALIQEFKRILKPDGKMLFTTPTPLSKPVLEFMAYRLKIIVEAEIRDHKKYYNKGDVLALAKRNGLTLSSYATFQLGMNSVMTLTKS